jgi:hypothetical protein
MQLRVARLCLDCEELHAENSCPVCASDRFAFLSKWLPVEERRRWPGRPTLEPRRSDGGLSAAVESVSNWFRGQPEPIGPLTRKSDHVAPLNFDDMVEPKRKQRTVEANLFKRDA